VVKHTFGGQ